MKVTSFDRAMVATAAVLGALTTLEMTWPHALRRTARDDAASESVESVLRATPRLEVTRAYATAIDRPLFTVDRRPYQPPPDAAAQAAIAVAAPELNARLLAVVTVAAEKLILLQVGGGNAVRKLKTGETVDGWTVRRVEDASATLSDGRFEHTVALTSGPAATTR
jgi:hypothetical protein